ncbi:MAG: 2,3,4,5-tetrahydropyridine-2,6-dicarboxylate N-succinyltransferase, partial [Wolbachia pipientis]|nr:2,3,4,5-tetrahydropyridine-2,6-dicarboxylate N-succinyltransferase [Wolbachia pipientis]
MKSLQLDKIQNHVENIWKNRNELISSNVKVTVKAVIKEIIELLDCGKIRVAEKLSNGQWIIHIWIKQ